mgnify:CR=1 FL=1
MLNFDAMNNALENHWIKGYMYKRVVWIGQAREPRDGGSMRSACPDAEQ